MARHDTFVESSTYIARGNEEPTTPWSFLAGKLVRDEGMSWADACSEAARRRPDLWQEHDALWKASMTGDASHISGHRALVRQAFSDWQRECEQFAEGEARGVRGSVLTAQERQYIDANRGDASDEYVRLVQVLHEAVMAEYPEMRKDVAWRIATELVAKREPKLAKAEQQRVDEQIARLGGHHGD